MIESAKLPITGPCPIDLDTIGFDRTSKNAHCTHCSKSVHNLSRMSETEARSFLADHAGARLCVSYAKGSDGKIKFAQPEPAPATIIPLRRLVRKAPSRSPAVAAAAGLAAVLAACTPVDNPNHRPNVAGEMMVKPTPVEVVEHPAGGIEVPVIEPVEIVDGEIEVEPPPQERVLAGEMAIPEVTEVLEGDMMIPEPETLVQGEAMPVDPDKPCAGTKKPEAGEVQAPKPPGTMQQL